MKVGVILFLIFALAGKAFAVREGRLLKRTAKNDRKLFLTLDRNQKFYRQEDRQRCEVISPGRNEQTHERANAAAADKNATAANRV